MSITSRENGKPLSTADLARAGRRGEGTANPHTDVDYTEEEVTRLDVAQPPGLERPKAAADADADMRERAPARSREARDDERSTTTSSDPAPARARADSSEETLEPLFASGLAESFRERWISIQSGFVDDPKQAVRRGDELVAEVMSNLAQGFATERQRMEAQLDETGEGATENLRVALRRYRSFFERLLSL